MDDRLKLIFAKVKTSIDSKYEAPDKFEKNVKIMQTLDDSKRSKKRAEKQSDTEEYDVNDDDNFGTIYSNRSILIMRHLLWFCKPDGNAVRERSFLFDLADCHSVDLAVLRGNRCFDQVGYQAHRYYVFNWLFVKQKDFIFYFLFNTAIIPFQTVIDILFYNLMKHFRELDYIACLKAWEQDFKKNGLVHFWRGFAPIKTEIEGKSRLLPKKFKHSTFFPV